MIDLHLHSIYSDGMLSPVALVELAKSRGLQAISITDHDTVAGTAEALERADCLDVEVIPGVEVSAAFDNLSLHILGYRFRHEDPLLRERLRKLQKGRQARNIHIIEKFNNLGIMVSRDELKVYSDKGQTGRPHFARLLMDKGVVKTVEQAFARYLKKGAAAYVERFQYPAKEAVAMIRDAGGFAVLAHPAKIDLPLHRLPGLLVELKKIGLVGLEVYHPGHSAKSVKVLRRLAGEFGLLITGGSDFHGDNRYGFYHIPEHLLEDMKKNSPDFFNKVLA